MDTPTSVPVRLFEWDHRRVACTACGRSILWPTDEQSPPICEPCWDQAADAATYERGRHPWTVEEMAIIARELEPTVPGTPARAVHVRSLAARFGVSTRTIHRLARKVERLVPIATPDGWSALFVSGDGERPPTQVTAWQLSTA